MQISTVKPLIYVGEDFFEEIINTIKSLSDDVFFTSNSNIPGTESIPGANYTVYGWQDKSCDELTSTLPDFVIKTENNAIFTMPAAAYLLD